MTWVWNGREVMVDPRHGRPHQAQHLDLGSGGTRRPAAAGSSRAIPRRSAQDVLRRQAVDADARGTCGRSTPARCIPRVPGRASGSSYPIAVGMIRAICQRVERCKSSRQTPRHGRPHLAVEPLGQLGVEDRVVIASGMISTTASLPSLVRGFFQDARRPLEIERIESARDDVQLALELGAERGPVPLEDEPDVVRFPCPGNLEVDGAGGPIPELSRPAVAVERAEDGLERAELAAPADHVVHPRELVVEEHRDRCPSGRSAGRSPSRSRNMFSPAA